MTPSEHASAPPASSVGAHYLADVKARFESIRSQAILARWAEGWGILFETLGALTPADLTRTVTIRGEAHTVIQALSRQLVHQSQHAGQVVLLAKHAAGARWKTLSIPRGQSKAFTPSPGTPHGGSGSRLPNA